MKIKNKLIVYILLGMMISSSLLTVKANMNIQEEQLVDALKTKIIVTNSDIVPITISAKDFISKDTKFVDVIILFKMGVKVSLTDSKIKVEYKHLNGLSAKIPEKLYYFFKNAWFVNAISIEKAINENNERSYYYCEDTLSNGADDIDAEMVWGEGDKAVDIEFEEGKFTGKGVKVGVIDTGIDTTHTDFAGTLAGGRNFYDNNSNIEDYGSYHGTKCAGVIAAGDNDWGQLELHQKLLFML
jgi:hypothetical protein